MSSSLKLSVLDFGVRRNVRPTTMAAHEIRRMAQLCDELGFHRFWLSEHHATGDIWGAPSVMLGFLAMHTHRIRVGSAGSLAAFHDPYDVAQDYRLLEALYPGRIDLGIAGGFPTRIPHRQRHEGSRDRTVYPRHVEALVRYVRMRGDPRDPVSLDETPVPIDVPIVAPWLLGTGQRSLELAIRLGVPLCYSLFHVPDPTPEILREYFDRYAPSPECPAPEAAITAAVICAETEAQARRIREIQAETLKARAVPVDVFGSPRQCAEQLHALADRYGVREVVLHDVSRTVPERQACYRLLAEALGLGAASSIPAPASPRAHETPRPLHAVGRR